MPTATPRPKGNFANRILQQLPEAELAALSPHLEAVEMVHGKTVHAAGAPIDFIYFVESGFISVVAVLEDGQPQEIGLIGSEGLAGGSVALGADRSFGETMVQMAGAALRAPVGVFRDQIDASEKFRKPVLRYVHALHVQVAQTAACNCRHALEQRLARWLLAAHDRGVQNKLSLTQEFLSMMLGVRRSTVTVAAGILQKAGLIVYRHGRIEIADRARLEDAACECYAVVAEEYRRLLES